MLCLLHPCILWSQFGGWCWVPYYELLTLDGFHSTLLIYNLAHDWFRMTQGPSRDAKHKLLNWYSLSDVGNRNIHDELCVHRRISSACWAAQRAALLPVVGDLQVQMQPWLGKCWTLWSSASLRSANRYVTILSMSQLQKSRNRKGVYKFDVASPDVLMPIEGRKRERFSDTRCGFWVGCSP